MPEMKVTCPTCQVVIRLANGPEGKSSITCPKCQARVSLGFKEPAPAKPKRRRLRRGWDAMADDGRSSGPLFGEELWGTFGLLGLGVVLAVFCFIGTTTAWVCVIAIAILVGILSLYGSIWFLWIAFQEDAVQGLLCLFVPFYSLYYLISRFGDCYRTLVPQVGSLLMLLIMFGGIVIAGLGKIAEKKAEREEYAKQHGITNLPRGPSFPAAPPRAPIDPPNTQGVSRDDPAFIDAALKDLRSNEPNNRRHAAQALAEMRPTGRSADVARALVEGVKDPSADVRVASTRALAVWGGKEHADVFLDVLRDKNQEAAAAAITYFGRHRDDRAIQPLIAWMPRLKDDVKKLLREYGPAAEKAVAAAAGSGTGDVRRAALEFMTEQGSAEAKAIMIEAINDPDHFISHEAVEYFKKNKTPEAADALAGIMHRHRNAAEALRALGAAAEKPVLALFQRTDGRGQREAIELLRDIGTKDSVPALREQLFKRNHDQDAVKGALQAIAKRSPKDFPADQPPIWEASPVDLALADVKGSDFFRRRDAFAALAKHDPGPRKDEVLKAVEGFLDDKDGHNRRGAITVLGTWGGPEAIPRLIKLVDDSDHGIREAVITALGASKDERAIPAIASRLPDFWDGKHAIKALIGFGDKAQKEVSKYLLHENSGVRIEACKIIAQIGNEDAILAMTNLSKQTKDKNLAQEAAKALIQIKARTMKSP